MYLRNGSSGNVNDRTMISSSGDVLHYNFYPNAGWRIGVTRPADYSIDTGTGMVINKTYFGGILTNQFVSPGIYSDILTINVIY